MRDGLFHDSGSMNKRLNLDFDVFSVFAPTNAAFDKLPTAVLTALTTNEEFKYHLARILLYHVTYGKLLAADISDGEKINTLLFREQVTASVSAGTVEINNSTVTSADIEASNGVIHVLGDTVLLPEFMTKNVVEVADSAGIFKTLLAAADAAGVADILKTSSPITLFAPNDAAFEKLGQDKINALLQDKNALADILKYHVVPDSIILSSEIIQGPLTTLQGGSIKTEYTGWLLWKSISLNGDAKIIDFDVFASNGIIHIIDTVLTPSSTETPTVAELAESVPELSSLFSAITAAGLVDTLNGVGPFTVFAPTNKAFEDLGQETLNALLDDTDALANILKYHVISGTIFSSDLEDGTTVATLSGASVEIDVGWWWWPWITLNRDASVTDADNEASNGVVHIIDKVLIPPTDLVATASAEGLDTLVQAIKVANLESALMGNGSLTIFAPTDEAFAKLGEGVLDSLLADPESLAQVLLYHVVPGRVARADLKDGSVETLKTGSFIDVYFHYFWFFFLGIELNDSASIVKADISASNGIIHTIDEVLAF
jgi:transforming growth factor-beta-induced protein